MKLVTAVVKPHTWEDVCQAFEASGVSPLESVLRVRTGDRDPDAV